MAEELVEKEELTLEERLDRLEAIVAISIQGNAVYFQANNDAIKDIMMEIAKIRDKLMPYQTRASGIEVIR